MERARLIELVRTNMLLNIFGDALFLPHGGGAKRSADGQMVGVRSASVQGLTGSKVSYHSILYRSITQFSVETAGSFDADAELKDYAPEQVSLALESLQKIYELAAAEIVIPFPTASEIQRDDG